MTWVHMKQRWFWLEFNSSNQFLVFILECSTVPIYGGGIPPLGIPLFGLTSEKGIPPPWADIMRRELTGQNVRRFYGT